MNIAANQFPAMLMYASCEKKANIYVNSTLICFGMILDLKMSSLKMGNFCFPLNMKKSPSKKRNSDIKIKIITDDIPDLFALSLINHPSASDATTKAAAPRRGLCANS
jgi:hypothetical protein